jgi:hypothetical protein
MRYFMNQIERQGDDEGHRFHSQYGVVVSMDDSASLELGANP